MYLSLDTDFRLYQSRDYIEVVSAAIFVHCKLWSADDIVWCRDVWSYPSSSKAPTSRGNRNKHLRAVTDSAVQRLPMIFFVTIHCGTWSGSHLPRISPGLYSIDRLRGQLLVLRGSNSPMYRLQVPPWTFSPFLQRLSWRHKIVTVFVDVRRWLWCF